MSYGQTWHIADKYPWACKLATCSCVDICCCCLGLADKSNEILVSWQICRIWKNPLAIHNATQPWAVLSPWQNIPAATRLTMERAHRKLNVGQVQKGVDPFWTGSHSQAYMSVYEYIYIWAYTASCHSRNHCSCRTAPLAARLTDLLAKSRSTRKTKFSSRQVSVEDQHDWIRLTCYFIYPCICFYMSMYISLFLSYDSDTTWPLNPWPGRVIVIHDTTENSHRRLPHCHQL